MHRICFVAVALMLLVSCPAFSQEWSQYSSKTDYFAVAFPGEPK